MQSNHVQYIRLISHETRKIQYAHGHMHKSIDKIRFDYMQKFSKVSVIHINVCVCVYV